MACCRVLAARSIASTRVRPWRTMVRDTPGDEIRASHVPSSRDSQLTTHRRRPKPLRSLIARSSSTPSNSLAVIHRAKSPPIPPIPVVLSSTMVRPFEPSLELDPLRRSPRAPCVTTFRSTSSCLKSRSSRNSDRTEKGAGRLDRGGRRKKMSHWSDPYFYESPMAMPSCGVSP